MLIVASEVRNKRGYLMGAFKFKRSSSSSLLLMLSPSTKDPNKAVTRCVTCAGDPRGWLGLQSHGVRFVGL